jgi:RND superfamily putative drug exporter
LRSFKLQASGGIVRGWAEFVLRHRRWVIGFWLLVIVVGGALSSKVNDRLTIDFSLPGQPGTETAQKIQELVDNGGFTSPYIVTVTVPQGKVTDPANATAIDKAFGALAKRDALAVPAQQRARVLDAKTTNEPDTFTTDDGKTAYALVFYRFDQSPSQKLLTDPIKKVVGGSLKSDGVRGTTIGVTGEDVLASGDSSSGPGVLGEVLLGGVGALAVLLFVFGSFLAFLPLIVAAASILATFIMLLPITYATDVSFIVEFLVALIGLGVAIDYSLLFVTRWREERDHGRDNHEAVVVAMQTAGRAVVFSGVTVAIGLLALIVLPVPFMRSMGYGGALIPVASVLTTLSFTPAILGGIGPRIDWPKIRHETRASKFWSGWARGVVKYRVASAVAALAMLGVLIAVFFGVKIGQASSASLAHSGQAYEALQTLEKGGVANGSLTPIEMLVDKSAAPKVIKDVEAVDGIRTVLYSKDPASTPPGSDQTVLVAIPENETVNSKSIQVVRDVQHVLDGEQGVTGSTGLGAAQIDFLHAVYGNFPLMLAIIALLTYLLLVRAFRSLLLPLKAIILNLLSLGATFGAMVFFWQEGHGSKAIFNIAATGAVTFWIPLMVFAFLFGLSMDYEVFILSRIREEYDGARSTDAAVIEGIGRTGRLVTCAALILFLAFTALATGPGTDLKTMATGLGIGILLDATIVRALLVPALVSLFGKWNWYLPAWAAKILRVEPSYPHDEPPRGQSLVMEEPETPVPA